MNRHTSFGGLFSRPHPDISARVLDEISGVPNADPGDIPTYGARQTVARKPALVLRPSDGLGLKGRWTIVDRLSAQHKRAMGLGTRAVRFATGHGADDLDGAKVAFLAYVEEKRARVLAAVAPADVPVAAIILTYDNHLESGAHNLAPGTVKCYREHLATLSEWWGDKCIGDVNDHACHRYEKWRRKQRVRNRKTLVSATQANHEITTLVAAINHFQKRTPLNVAISTYKPTRDTPEVVWLRRDEVARYLWACRGRIAVVERDGKDRVVSWRWRVARDDDPTLAGPEGDRRALRDRDEIDQRTAEGRRVLINLYTASRNQKVVDMVYRDNGKDACLSLLEDAVRRSPIGLRQTNKRTPPVPLAPPLRSFAALWAFCDVQRLGFLPERIVCRQNGLPWSPSGLSKVRERIHKDSGLDKSVTANMLRHTCAMWMKIGGVTAHEAANFLGCSITIMQERYGTWDPLSMYSAIDALTNAKKLKEAARRAKAEGIPF